MKRLLKTLKGKWPEYLIESIVIIASILGAYALDNWNERRKEKAFEANILQQVKTGLVKDISDLKYNRREHQKSLKAQREVLKWLKSNDPYVDNLCVDFAAVNIFTAFVSNDEAFETLNLKGVDILSNDSLKNVLVHLYENTYDYHDEMEEIYNDWMLFKLKTIDPQLFEGYFVDSSVRDYVGCQRPIDVQHLKNSREYYFHIQNLVEYNTVFISLMERAEKEAERLIDLINNELE